MPLGRRHLLTKCVPGLLASANFADAKMPSGNTVKSRSRTRPIVMLDPGHGGKDPGCIGLHGTEEKMIALSATLELRRRLMAGGHYHVEMTRRTDVFVPLDERVDLAQRARAQLLISLHANAAPDHTARGASVYTFAFKASDARSAAAALRENSADRDSWKDVSPKVGRILFSLLRHETLGHSVRIQRDLVSHIHRHLPVLHPFSRHARFAVLRAPAIPSVLVEMGFLTNPADERLLGQVQHRAKLAAAMAAAVDQYFSSIRMQ
jgi:N-acetylmuramoyl-L-alanine amidase